MTVTTKRKSLKRAGENRICFLVNGNGVDFGIGEEGHQVGYSETLAETLRERLGLTGTKVTCDTGACGTCTVLMDGKSVLSCMTLTIECGGKNITTIEGLRDPETGALDPIQQAFIDEGAFQCGFCTPGIIMSAKALLLENGAPTEEEVKESLSGNFCRCITHYQVVRAVLSAAPGGK